jgi:diacylglycerol kinase family enzyme
VNLARRLDRAAYEKVARTDFPPPADRFLRDITEAAGHSALWTAMATGMGLSGRMSLRRAALRGMIAIGIASPLANVAVKQLTRRRRPLNDVVPLVRRAAMPGSTSFPSGHAASAAAFATGVAMEAPLPVAVGVGVLAGLVGFSRVYVGVHYPADVLVGAALGVGAGLATKALWDVPPRQVATEHIASPDVDPRGKGVIAVINHGAGKGAPLRPVPVSALLREQLPDAEVIEPRPGDDLAQVLDDAASRAAVLAVAGGDGTVSAAAAAALRHDRPLLVLPAGTLNHFARALGLETPNDALHAYRAGDLAQVDVGMANGQPFVNTASFGIYSDLVRERDRLEKRLGKWPALAVAAPRVLRRAQPVTVSIDDRQRDVWLVFFGNCRYLSKGPAPTWRKSLDDGLIDVRVVLARHRLPRGLAIVAMLTSGLRFTPDYRRNLRSEVKIAADATLEFAHDGEYAPIPPEFTITKRPAALRVFVSRPARPGDGARVRGRR